MAEELRLLQKQLRELLSSNVESLLAHVEDPKLLESSVTRLMGFVSAGQEISERLIRAEKAIGRCQYRLESAGDKSNVEAELREWVAYREALVEQMRGLTVRLRNI